MNKDVILQYQKLKGVATEKYRAVFLYVMEVKLFKVQIRGYNFRKLNVIPMVTAKKIENIHKRK